MVTKGQSGWLFTVLIGPIVVGVILAGVGFGLPKILSKGKHLSYLIDGPAIVLNQKLIGKSKILINNIPTSDLFLYRVHLRNVGDQPLKDLSILFVFETSNKSFRIFDVRHETEPAKEFGKITEQTPDPWSKRFTYELLNQKEQDVITFLTNEPPKLSAYAKQADLKFTYDLYVNTVALADEVLTLQQKDFIDVFIPERIKEGYFARR